jgi:hypothetical protein
VGRSFSSDIISKARSAIPFVNRATARFSLRSGSAASKGGAFPACFRVARSPPGPIRPREVLPLSLHLNKRNYCAIISRALISLPQGGHMLHAARASVNRATARFSLRSGSAASKGSAATPPSPNQSIAKHNRKPAQLAENKHQRPKSIASFCRCVAVSQHVLTFQSQVPQFLIASRPGLEIELTPSQQTRKLFLIASFSASLPRAPLFNNRLHKFLTATDPNSENWQSHENKREKIF